jgi:uncharacterized RDD family membrane protein YckC
VTVARQSKGVSRIVGTFVNPVVSAVDVDAVLEHVDLDELLQRVDIDKILDRLDVNRIVERVDVEAVVERVDINRIVESIDIPNVVKRAEIANVMTDSAGAFAASALDMVRRAFVGADSVLCHLAVRLLRRNRLPAKDPSQSIVGWPAGPVTRLAGFLVDVGVVSVAVSLFVFVASYLIGLFLGHTVHPQSDSRFWSGAVLALVGVLYSWACVTMTGRTFGRALVGLRVLQGDGTAAKGSSALVRVVVFPLSLVLFLGLIPIFTGRDRRAFHDHVAKTMVVYDWGRREAHMPSGVSRWLGSQYERSGSDRAGPSPA